MTIQVTGKNLDVGEALRSHVLDKLEETLDKHVGGQWPGHVRIEKEHGRFRTDLTVHLWGGLSLEAHGKAHDAYASADAALERIEKRIRRYTRRLKKHSAQGSAETSQGTQSPYYVIQSGDEESEEPQDDNPVIIAETELAIHELAVADAVLQMDLSDRPFVVFRNASHGQINVVYRRQDGNIGWIDPAGVTKPAGKR